MLKVITVKPNEIRNFSNLELELCRPSEQARVGRPRRKREV